MTKTMEKARSAVADARAMVERWGEVLTNATALRESAQSEVPASPDDLDAAADGYVKAEGRVKAARAGAAAAEGQVLEALAGVVRAGIADAKSAGAEVDKRKADHDRRVTELLDKLNALDGAEYHRKTRDCVGAGAYVTGAAVPLGTSQSLAQEAAQHHRLVRVLTFILDRGALPTSAIEVGMSTLESMRVPDYAHEYIAARRDAEERISG